MKDCSRHLKEAIELNTKRLGSYAQLSKGDTIPFSKKLIRYERWALKGAWIFDWIGDHYQNKGLPYMKNEFVEMSEVGLFQSQYPEGVKFDLPLRPIKFTSFIQKAKQLNRQKDTIQLVGHCNELLAELARQEHVYCMVRHMIESIRRVAFLIPIHEQHCHSLHIKNPVRYSRWLIWLHLQLIPQSIDFDETIAPIQNRNIPFLYQDLPYISIDLADLNYSI